MADLQVEALRLNTGVEDVGYVTSQIFQPISIRMMAPFRVASGLAGGVSLQYVSCTWHPHPAIMSTFAELGGGKRGKDCVSVLL